MIDLRILALKDADGNFAAYIAAKRDENGQFKFEDLVHIGTTPVEAGQQVQAILEQAQQDQQG